MEMTEPGQMQEKKMRDFETPPATTSVGEKPEWQRPVTSVLEIDEITMNTGDSTQETGFSFNS
jgi:hypothetical protein